MTLAPAIVPPPAPPPPSTAGIQVLIGALLVGTAGMLILLFVHLSRDRDSRPTAGAAGPPTCRQGERDCLPEVNYIDTDGVAYPYASLAGKIVLVNFWATWCRPCQKEIPDLSRMYDKYKAKGVVFLGVMTDTPDDQSLLNFKSDHEMSYPVVRANSDVMVSYGYPDAMPTTFVYDRRGKQIYNHIGLVRERDLDLLLGQLIAQR